MAVVDLPPVALPIHRIYVPTRSTNNPTYQTQLPVWSATAGGLDEKAGVTAGDRKGVTRRRPTLRSSGRLAAYPGIPGINYLVLTFLRLLGDDVITLLLLL